VRCKSTFTYLLTLHQGNNQHHKDAVILIVIYRVAQNKIPHQTICNFNATSGLILKILEAA